MLPVVPVHLLWVSRSIEPHIARPASLNGQGSIESPFAKPVQGRGPGFLVIASAVAALHLPVVRRRESVPRYRGTATMNGTYGMASFLQAATGSLARRDVT
jgi:hypothetical protein